MTIFVHSYNQKSLLDPLTKMTNHLFKTPKHLFSLLLFSIIFSCSPIKLDTTKNEESSSLKDPKDMIISIILNVYKSSSTKKDSLSLYEISIVDGLLKKDITPAPKRVSGKWMLSFLNAEHELIKNTILDDPLTIEHEYVIGNEDDLKFEHVEMQLEKATLTVRARYSPDMKAILIEKTDSLGNPGAAKLFKIRE
ncbi:hypothetical protein AWE51_15605 [Aquimarina aggregata]|uniref:Uncharacterized protein n=1 Tax=Aquimarina aggregata TaxID=1642818 RepID=A0A163CVJ9_9FLAO|nr:hypothetical protein [Aquimarina aggregata]KZS42795.1 hypothetical protein AWE51_15605 [Aquimarina aggregata]